MWGSMWVFKGGLAGRSPKSGGKLEWVGLHEVRPEGAGVTGELTSHLKGTLISSLLLPRGNTDSCQIFPFFVFFRRISTMEVPDFVGVEGNMQVEQNSPAGPIGWETSRSPPSPTPRTLVISWTSAAASHPSVALSVPWFPHL